MSDDNNGGGFGLFILFSVAAGIVLIMNPIEEDHLATLVTHLGHVTEETTDAEEVERIDSLGELVDYQSYYLWSVTRLTKEASEKLTLDEELVMSVGALGTVWSPVDLQVFGARYDANMKVVQDGLVEAARTLEAVNPKTISAAEKIVGDKVAEAVDGAAEVVAEGAASAAALTEAANEAVKKQMKAQPGAGD